MGAEPAERPCPICGKPAAPRFRPFCSGRCSDVDLQSWLTNRYAIPAEEDDERPDIPDEPGFAGQRERGSL